MPTAVRTSERTQFLTFSLSGGEYAIAVLRVREIIEHEEVTRVPSTPAFLRGVINLRGSVVPVVDLARKFRMPESPVTKRTCIIIVEVESENGRIVLGVLADSVNQVVEFRPDEIEPPPSFGTPVRVDFLRGLGKLNGEFILILDTDRVLSAGELADAASAPEASASPAGADISAAAARGGRA